MGLPGTGISYSTKVHAPRHPKPVPQTPGPIMVGRHRHGGKLLACLAVVAIAMVVALANQKPATTAAYSPAPSDGSAGAAVILVTPAQAAVAVPSLHIVTVTHEANLRRGPSVHSIVVREMKAGEVLSVYGISAGWLNVGVSQPDGWVAASLVR